MKQKKVYEECPHCKEKDAGAVYAYTENSTTMPDKIAYQMLCCEKMVFEKSF